jgi:hypothetical protein
MREKKAMLHEFRAMLKKCASICGYREMTILKWMKPSERRVIYDKAEKMMKEEGEANLTFSDMLADGAKLNIDTSQILDDNVRLLLCSPSHIFSLGSDAVLKNSNNSNTR